MITDKDREEAKIICSAIKIPIELSVGGLKIVTTVSTGEILAKMNSDTIAQILYGIRAESAEQARKQHEKEMLDEIKQRDSAEDFIDKLLDLLDVEHEWSNVFGYNEAYQEAESELDQIRSFSAYEARHQARKEADEQLALERDTAEETINKILDLFPIRHEWSNGFDYENAINAVDATIDNMRAEIAKANAMYDGAKEEAAERAVEWFKTVFCVPESTKTKGLRAAILGDSAPVSTDSERLAIAVRALENIIDGNDLACERGESMASWMDSDFRRQAKDALKEIV